MNPLTNRWAALIVVAVLLLGVSELVGTSDKGGILSQFAASRAAEETETPPAIAVADTGPAPVVEESEPEVEEDEDGTGDVDVDVEDDPFAAVDEPEPELVEDDEPAVAGTSIVSRQPPGPPGVFTEQ
jgi:hypothetical protein